MTACGNGTTDKTKFEGKWLNTDIVQNNGYTDFSYTFTGGNFVLNAAGPETYNLAGTFEFTETVIAFTSNVDGEAPRTVTQAYTLNGNTLNLGERLSGPAFSFHGNFIKQ